MTINTKYNIGDKIFRMYENKVIEDEIEQIIIRVKKSQPGFDVEPPEYIDESYILRIGGGGLYSDKFFPTKEALLNSL